MRYGQETAILYLVRTARRHDAGVDAELPALTMAACIFTRRVLGWLLPYLIRSVPREVAEDLGKTHLALIDLMVRAPCRQQQGNEANGKAVALE